MTEQAPDPTLLLAQLDESEALIRALRERTAMLNAEVRRRDAEIAALTALIEPAPESEES